MGSMIISPEFQNKLDGDASHEDDRGDEHLYLVWIERRWESTRGKV